MKARTRLFDCSGPSRNKNLSLLAVAERGTTITNTDLTPSSYTTPDGPCPLRHRRHQLHPSAHLHHHHRNFALISKPPPSPPRHHRLTIDASIHAVRSPIHDEEVNLTYGIHAFLVQSPQLLAVQVIMKEATHIIVTSSTFAKPSSSPEAVIENYRQLRVIIINLVSFAPSPLRALTSVTPRRCHQEIALIPLLSSPQLTTKPRHGHRVISARQKLRVARSKKRPIAWFYTPKEIQQWRESR